ncbi:MAG: hypothetical protein K8I00_08700 [Candidatus Omnitrophica bacterium]|nr:hypothetical protein [Candidatus Omnitrophota bacterium]
MDKEPVLDWDALGREVKNSHARLRVLLECPHDQRHRSPENSARMSGLEAALFAHFKIHSDGLYGSLEQHYRFRTESAALIRALQEGLIILKVLFLDYLDADRAATRKFYQELLIRIRLEEDYLLPLVQAVVEQDAQRGI